MLRVDGLMVVCFQKLSSKKVTDVSVSTVNIGMLCL